MSFADDLDANLRAGDRSLEDFVAMVDHYVNGSGLDVPPPPERLESVPDPFASPLVLDVAANRVNSVIWATGYHLDFNWIEVPVFDTAGAPIHRRGVTAVPGLYFLGLPWLHKRKSTFLAGVGEDASFIADVILGARSGRTPGRADKGEGPGANRSSTK